MNLSRSGQTSSCSSPEGDQVSQALGVGLNHSPDSSAGSNFLRVWAVGLWTLCMVSVGSVAQLCRWVALLGLQVLRDTQVEERCGAAPWARGGKAGWRWGTWASGGSILLQGKKHKVRLPTP